MNITVIAYCSSMAKNESFDGSDYIESDLKFKRFDNAEDAAKWMFDYDNDQSEFSYEYNVLDNLSSISKSPDGYDESMYNRVNSLYKQLHLDREIQVKIEAKAFRIKQAEIKRDRETRRKANLIANEKRTLARLKKKYDQ